MNSYQKLGTFLSRLIGSVVALVGFVGPLHYGASRLIGASALEYATDRFLGSLMWAISGVILILFSKGIGRLLGGGLE